MDEVENPALPAAGESSPTLGPVAPSPLAQTSEPQTSPVPSRPPLKRDVSQPPPEQPEQPAPPAPPAQPAQPPPAPPAQPAETGEFPSEAPDSLTLADLKRIRSTFPNAQTAARQQVLETDKIYDFDYRDAQSLPVEIEEWFSYSDEEHVRLRKCKAMFNLEWRAGGAGAEDEWVDASDAARTAFVRREVETLKLTRGKSATSLMILVYLGLGVWEETAGRRDAAVVEDVFAHSTFGGSRLEDYTRASGLQIRWIVKMVEMLHEVGGLKVIYDILRTVCEHSLADSPVEQSSRDEAQPKRGEESAELWCCLTLMYLFIEVARTASGAKGAALKADILALEPKLVNYFAQMTARLRWDDIAPVPLTKMLLLTWKTILVTFGGIADVEALKSSLRPQGPTTTNSTSSAIEAKERQKSVRESKQPLITASPLEYNLFRQELTSKYPAYQPPPPLFPLEPENNSILPPLKHRRPSTYSTPDTSSLPGATPSVVTNSIMHQPVHIATPAPSPPPSPAGPGKAGKKQNYQTNQMFPFLYPPLDESSSALGGKGSTRVQDELVGRKWEGSDVPASILEAAELFAGRMRRTRGLGQLWEARGGFMEFERGWKVGGGGGGEDDDEDGNGDVPDGFELVKKPEKPEEETAGQGEPVKETEQEKKLREVGEYYRDSLPHLQSLVIVLLKAVLQNVTDLVTKSNGQNGGAGLQAGIQFDQPNGVTNGSARAPLENGNADGMENTAEELDRLRSQEIAAKALSAILLLLLKWFKVSHVLQYEYMTQLLLDSNYVPLILKLWQTQEIGRACHYQTDKAESNFFNFCRTNSRQGAPQPQYGGEGTTFEESEEDEAMPPPIKRTRDEGGSGGQGLSPTSSAGPNQLPSAAAPMHPPEVDELGYPLTPLPLSPIKQYSYRNLFSAINYLRILQKVTRRKTHRALLLVSYKSSNHLKKTLKVPVKELRYYTLKVFKSQVPFCGRKWRQGNMKIITSVWLSVPAELRDDWLSGGGGGMGGQCVGDVDGTVEDALPLEQSLRALTHWWNVRNYPDVTGVDKAMLEEEMDYFTRELEKMEVRSDVDAEGLGQEEGLLEGGPEGWQGPIEGY